MPDFRPLNNAFNPSDVRQYFHYDEAEDKSTVYQEQDVEPILRANKIEMNHIDQSGNFMKHVACIPRIVIEQWRKEGLNFFDPNDWKKIQQKLNSNEFRYFRTWHGDI
tara:strand:+ start:124 stop:447 length:324 start_codon:yes stop_codon:yes gene_type:complete